jgi:hypothetical protein
VAPSQGSKPPTRARSKARSVLIALDPPSFIRLIEHLIHGHPGLRIVGRSSKSGALALAGRLAPDVIIANTRPLAQPGDVLAEIKRSSPASTLILLTHAAGEPVSPHGGADACLPEDAVVTRLLPLLRKLESPRPGSQPSSLREHRRSCLS